MANGAKMWMKHVRFDYKECVGEDPKNKWVDAFSQMMSMKPGETLVFSYIVFKSCASRSRQRKGDERDGKDGRSMKEMPFDMKRMVYGGFKIMVEV